MERIAAWANIAAAMAKVMPEYADEFAASAEAYIAKLKALSAPDIDRAINTAWLHAPPIDDQLEDAGRRPGAAIDARVDALQHAVQVALEDRHLQEQSLKGHFNL